MMWKVRFNDLRPKGGLAKELADAYYDVMHSGIYILGEQVALFEHEFAEYIGTRYCVSLGNGFEALVIALRATDTDGIDVATPANAPIPTWMAVTQSGNKVSPVEVDDHTMLMKVEDKSWHHRRYIAVHMYGAVVNIDDLKDSARKNILPVKIIEDCAQAHGASLNGRKVGSLGDVGAWSFYPTKNLGCYGDGGAITTDSDSVADTAKLMRQYGDGEMRGINSRLDELQAAFLRIKLRRLDDENEKRIYRATRYYNQLFDEGHVICPSYKEGDVFHQYVIRVKKAEDRSKLYGYLRSEGIQVCIHYPVVPGRMPVYRMTGFTEEDQVCRKAQKMADCVISLPIANATDEEIDYVCDKIYEFYA